MLWRCGFEAQEPGRNGGSPFPSRAGVCDGGMYFLFATPVLFKNEIEQKSDPVNEAFP